MAHIHNVYDNDRHFIIDPATREINNESGKFVLIQHDHNSERITFEIPKEIDGHNMMLCTSAKVHYLNIQDATGEEDAAENPGVYECDNLTIAGDKVTCSWLISRNATQYVGVLSFCIRFSCVTNGEEEYSWSTLPYNGIRVSDGIHNSEVAVGRFH